MKLYLQEIVTRKDDQTVISPTATFVNENSDEAYRLAEVEYTSKVNYNLQQKENLKDFLVEVFTETGIPVPEMKRFYRFAEDPQPEPEPNDPGEE